MFLRSFSKRLLAGSPLFVHYWCHPPHSSGNTRDPDTSRAKGIRIFIVGGRETLRMSVGMLIRGWLNDIFD